MPTFAKAFGDDMLKTCHLLLLQVNMRNANWTRLDKQVGSASGDAATILELASLVQRDVLVMVF